MEKKVQEHWLRGPVEGVPALLQPVAHALLQARDEVNLLLQNFPDDLLWQKPAAVASPGFHLQHLSGVLDRLFTYAAGQALSEEQLSFLKSEGRAPDAGTTTKHLLQAFQQQVEQSIERLKATQESALTEVRTVGRAKLPSTTIGLLFHAAEHTMRHTGQLYVTVKFLKQQ